jgi:membrane-bound metal-dependent hydrolase YbcI (DUF457 family)
LTVYEHVMVGVNLALGAGLHLRYGWRLAAVAGLAAALPDWDGLSILFGPAAYAEAHRVWGHNLLAASLLGGVVGAWAYGLNRAGWFTWIGKRLLPGRASFAARAGSQPRAPGSLALWIGTGVVAGLSHLLADFFYSGHGNSESWPLQLFWPFSTRGWAYPILPWGDLGATILFIVEMFLIYRWPARARMIAWGSLAAVVFYVGVRGIINVATG